MPCPTAMALGPEPLHRRADVVDERLERELGRVGGLAPVVVPKVEGVALPAAPGEVAEEALPGPRPAELAVDEQQRLPARSALGQPRLDVQAALVQLDLVLADGPAGWRRQSGVGCRGHLASGLIGELATRAG